MKVSNVVFGVGTSKDITIYEVLYSTKRRKISFNIILSKAVRRNALNLTLAHIHTHTHTHQKKKKRISSNSHVGISFTHGGSFTSTGPVHTYLSRSNVEDPVTRRHPVHRLGIGCPWSSTCNMYHLV